MFRKFPSVVVILSVVVVCTGVTIATVTDPIVVNNSTGLIVGVAGLSVCLCMSAHSNQSLKQQPFLALLVLHLAATCVTALYQIWVGSKQKELDANSSQLLLAYTPQATALLSILVPIFEPMGWTVRKLEFTTVSVGREGGEDTGQVHTCCVWGGKGGHQTAWRSCRACFR